MPGILTGDDLSWMRDVVQESFPSSCFLLRRTETPDGTGHQNVTTAQLGPFPCRVNSIVVRDENVEGGRVTATTAYEVVLPFDTDVHNSDKIEVAGGGTYEVRGFMGQRSEAVDLVVPCILIA